MKVNLTLFLFLLCFAVKAQNPSPENRIVVLGQASIDVPADQVKFFVDINSTDSSSVDKVYQQHKRLEDKMVKLLKDLQIPTSDVKYSLFSVSKRQDYMNRNKEEYFYGNQNITFMLKNLSQFTEVQARLIKEGFTGFRSSFMSSAIDKHTSEVLEKAIKVAWAKADIMAKAANRQIKRVVKVADTEDTDPIFINYRQSETLNEVVIRGQSSMSLFEFPQTIPVTTSVKVVFELK
ncbi:SIMPL domain-containing protein [Pontibacter arcticus]|uniref:SIMPL domain-containing protein n=1 Tax=Pontibacter arcticus TaxID=2080288 RepID=A0A364RDP7_9BACT|nr:SIMPL domain-containing protein [Pontibacter arcticus]RAU82394.1 hypothetical protein DP923_11455 [Pontibacter arcticus]